MIGVVEHVDLGTKFFSQTLEQLRNKPQIVFGGPLVDRRRVFLRRLIKHLAATDTVGTTEAGYSGLRAHSFVPELHILSKSLNSLLDVGAAGMTIDEHCFARCAA